MTRPRVVSADDHRLLREASARLFEPDCEVVGAVGDGRALLEAAPRLRPGVVVLDIAMPQLNGLDPARQLRRTQPDVKVIFLTMNEDPDIAAEAFRVGGPATSSRARRRASCSWRARRSRGAGPPSPRS